MAVDSYIWLERGREEIPPGKLTLGAGEQSIADEVMVDVALAAKGTTEEEQARSLERVYGEPEDPTN